MKILLFIPVITLLASSCRTATPIDPMTMKPSTRCLPGGDCQEVEATK
jgi:hypothetical protein